VNSVTYPVLIYGDPDHVELYRGKAMGGTHKRDPADTYIFDEDVMDELENFDSTMALSGPGDEFTDTLTQENELLDDIASSSIVLEGDSMKRKR
jgi:hypothetical protein